MKSHPSLCGSCLLLGDGELAVCHCQGMAHTFLKACCDVVRRPWLPLSFSLALRNTFYRSPYVTEKSRSMELPPTFLCFLLHFEISLKEAMPSSASFWIESPFVPSWFCHCFFPFLIEKFVLELFLHPWQLFPWNCLFSHDSPACVLSVWWTPAECCLLITIHANNHTSVTCLVPLQPSQTHWQFIAVAAQNVMCIMGVRLLFWRGSSASLCLTSSWGWTPGRCFQFTCHWTARAAGVGMGGFAQLRLTWTKPWAGLAPLLVICLFACSVTMWEAPEWRTAL